jgi:hypothetical protein
MTELLDLMQKQTDALAQLPRTISDLQGAVQQLTEATTKTRKAVDSAQRIVGRFESLIEDLGPTAEAMEPGLRAAGRIMDGPVVAALPRTLTRIHDDVMPRIQRLRRAQERMTSVADRFRRRQTGSGAPSRR